MSTTEKATIFVYCDDASHADKKPRVAVDNFWWDGERWMSQRSTQQVDAAGQVYTRHASPGYAIGDQRDRFVLECRKCRAPVSARYENLAAILDQHATRAHPELSLAYIVAKLSGSIGP